MIRGSASLCSGIAEAVRKGRGRGPQRGPKGGHGDSPPAAEGRAALTALLREERGGGGGVRGDVIIVNRRRSGRNGNGNGGWRNGTVEKENGRGWRVRSTETKTAEVENSGGGKGGWRHALSCAFQASSCAGDMLCSALPQTNRPRIITNWQTRGELKAWGAERVGEITSRRDGSGGRSRGGRARWWSRPQSLLGAGGTAAAARARRPRG